jgi:hypoxanthine phosphoribosyltransferase
MLLDRVIEAFVIMPFGNHNEYRDGNKESNWVYNSIIKPGIKAAFDEKQEFKISREVDKNAPGSITREIVRSLAHADIVVTDLSGRNANVFLELGIRFSLRNKVTVLIAQEGTTPPFDVGDYRVVFYSVVDPNAAAKQISLAIQESFQKSGKFDSLVFNSFPQISVCIPGYCESQGTDYAEQMNLMLWTEYWRRLQTLYFWLESPSQNGQFTPDAVIGISNGGLIVADLIGRMLYRGTPILSLWANRFSRESQKVNESFWFFDNPYNDAIIEVIKKRAGVRSTVILLLDDHLGTGTTARQAASYLKDRFDEQVDILFIPMFSNRPEYAKIVESLLPYRFREGSVFPNISEKSFWEGVSTAAWRFPYDKEISSGA